MTDKNNKQSPDKKVSRDKPNKPADKPTLGGETVEARILLSATWITGTAGDDTLSGTAADETLEGLLGNDILTGGAGDDTLIGGAGDDQMHGGAGNDTASFASASRGVQVDLTISTPQDTGDGIETITGIESVIGSKYDDTFAFSAPTASTTYTVDGGAGDNTLDLSTWDSSGATLNRGSITVDLGGGDSFQVDYENIGTVSFRDGDLIPSDLTDNARPNADAGVDQTVTEGDVVTLTASGSVDGDGDAITYRWVQTSGPSVRLSDATVATPTFTAPEGLTNTTVTFEVTASDGMTAAVDAVEITINADNDAPTADAGADQTADGNSLVTLDATGSSDPEGQGLTYTWVQTSGPAVALSDANAAQPTFTAPDTIDPTVIRFEVQVSDGKSVTVDTVDVTAKPASMIGNWTFDGAGQSVQDVSGSGNDGNLGFTSANALADPTRINDPARGDVLHFDGTQIIDDIGLGPSGSFSLASWVNHTGVGTNWDAVYMSQNWETGLSVEAQTGKVGLNVGGGVNWVETAAGAITADNWHHIAGTWDGAQARIYIDGVEVAVTVVGTLSDPEAKDAAIGAEQFGTNTSYGWRGMLDDVRAYDDVVDASVIASLAGNSDPAPTADAGADQTVSEGDLVTLDATASADPQGDALTYTWVQTSGPAVVLSDANAAQPTFTAPDTGSNTSVSFSVTVSDGTNLPMVDTVTVNVGTWIEGDSGSNTVSGTTGNDRIRAFAGDDTLTGSTGDDTLDGGTGSDTVDYSTASGSVTVDLTVTSAQDTGGSGTDTLSGIEGVTGSAFDDTFSFSNPVDGAVYTVDGGGGTNTIDLTNFTSTDITFADGTITVDLGGGESFQIDYSNVRRFQLGDLDARVMTSNTNAASYTGSSIWIDGPEAFRIDQSGAGSINWSYNVTTDTFAVTDTTSTDATTDLVIEELGGSDLSTSITIDKSLGSLTSNVDIDAITITAENDTIGTITVAGGSGTLGSFTTTSGDLKGTTVINANVTTISLNGDVKDPLTINGNVGSFSMTDVDGALRINGNVGTMTAGDINETTRIDGSVTNMTVANVDSSTTVGGSVTNLTANDVDAAVNIGGDLNTAVIATVDEDGTVSVSWATGVLSFQVDATEHGSTYASPTEFTFDGSTQTVAINVVGNTLPVADAGTDQVVSEGDLVTLNGANSSDIDGDSLTYTWVQTGGPTVTLSDPSAAQPTFTAPEGFSNTSVTFELQVTDGRSSSISDGVTITINADNDAPAADAGPNQVIQEGNVVTLNGSGSSDPEGEGLTYTWTQISGPTVELSDATAVRPQFSAPDLISNSIVQFELAVSDGTNTSTDVVVVGIGASDDAPSVDAGQNRVVFHNQDVQLTATATDPEGQALTYQWRQLAGPSVEINDADTQNPTFTTPYAPNGAVMRFEVAASDGNSTTYDTVNVVVAPNAGPAVQINGIQEARAGEFVALNASAVDIEGDGLSYTWTQLSGPTVTLSNNTDPQLQFQAPSLVGDGELTFQVEVSDGHRTTTTMVTVAVAGSEPASAPRTEAPTSSTSEPAATPVQSPLADLTTEELISGTALGTTAASAAPTSSTSDTDADTVEPVTLGEMTAVTLGTSAATLEDSMSDTSSDASRVDTSTPTTLTDETSYDSVLGSSLLDESSANALAAGATRLMQPDLVVADASGAIELRAPMTSMATSEEAAEVRWKQVSGMPVEILDDSGDVLNLSFPETFIDEEVVFEVEVIQGGQRVVQEVTVQVQAAGMTNRSLSIDEHTAQEARGNDTGDEQGSRGFGKIWGALLAFFGAQAGRKKQ